MIDEWQSGQYDNVLAFKAFRSELDLCVLFERLHHVGLPVIEWGGEDQSAMAFYSWSTGNPLVQNKYGIAEPVPSPESIVIPSERTLILVPALAIDRSGNRLGYGGGFYDRYLRQNKGRGLGCVAAQFVVDALPREDLDEQLAACVTENGIINF